MVSKLCWMLVVFGLACGAASTKLSGDSKVETRMTRKERGEIEERREEEGERIGEGGEH